MKWVVCRYLFSLLLLGLWPGWMSAQIEVDVKNLTFLATFDSSMAADFGKGKTKARVAADVSRKSFLDAKQIEGVTIDADGKFGSSLNFAKKTKPILCFPADRNFPYSKDSFDASISFWMKCDLEKLPKGFIDPLQITDKKWNDASIFVDFNDQRPADFRLGVFSDLSFWNPRNLDINKMEPKERPMVDAGKVAFAKDKWVHIGLVFQGINGGDTSAHCKLYIDGKLSGDLDRQQQFKWDVEKAFIMLGIYYVGRIDDFAIFNIALTDKQVKSLVESQSSVASLLRN